MIHLVVAIVSLILYVSGLFPPAVRLALLAIIWISGAYAFLSLDKHQNKKLAALRQASEEKDPLQCTSFVGEYVNFFDTQEEGLTDYYKVMFIREEGITFYGYCRKRRWHLLLPGFADAEQVRVYHDGMFVLQVEVEIEADVS